MLSAYLVGNELVDVYLNTVKESINSVKGLSLYTFSVNEQSPAEKQHSIMIFDDVNCGKKYAVRDYFFMGRQKNIDCFYI